jgi:hypothetical protein
LSSPEAEELRFKSAIVAWKETRESRRSVATDSCASG